MRRMHRRVWLLLVAAFLLCVSLGAQTAPAKHPARAALPKAPAVTLLTADHVVSMDGQGRIYEPGAVLVRGEKIEDIGPAADVLARHPRVKPFRLGDRWVMPGLVNTHTHLAMNPMRGVGDDLELMDWLKRYIFPLEAALVSPEYVYEATLTACAESIRRGVTTVADMYYFEDEVARAVSEAGLRGWLGQTVLDFPAPDCKTPEDALAAMAKSLERWKDDPLVRVVPSPHSLYTCSAKYVVAAKALADKYGVPMFIHLSENANEVKDVKARYDKTPVKAIHEMGALGPNVVAAHCVVLTDKDMEILARTGAKVSHNPDSNLKLASGMCPVTDLVRHGVAVGLGTDGSASNNRQDMFAAMDLASKVQKVRTGDPTAMKALDVVRMATVGGAEVLGAGARIGSLETGKLADLIVVDLSEPESAPVYNIFSHMVYVANSDAVESVMVNGRWLMRDHQLLTLSEQRIRALNEKWRRIISEKISVR